MKGNRQELKMFERLASSRSLVEFFNNAELNWKGKS